MSLMRIAEEDPKLTFAMLRFGWEETLEPRRERASTIGVIGALIFSVTLQMTMTPLAPTYAAMGSEDRWSDYRSVFSDIYHVLIVLGATFWAISVVTSALHILWLNICVSDSDDFIWLCHTYSINLWVDMPMVMALFFSVLSVGVGSISLYSEPVASVCLFSVAAPLSCTALAIIAGALPGERRTKGNFQSLVGHYSGFIDKAAREVENASSNMHLRAMKTSDEKAPSGIQP